MSITPELESNLRALNESARRLGRIETITEALQRLEAMAPVIAAGDEPLNPGEVMAYRRAKRQMAAIFAAMVPKPATTDGLPTPPRRAG